MAHDRPCPPQEVVTLQRLAGASPVLLGCDANSRHTLWGSSETNERGKELKKLPVEDIPTRGELDAKADSLNKAFGKALTKACPLRYGKKARTPWWNEKLTALRKQVRKSFNECYRIEVWDLYRENLKKYKKAIRDAKEASWREFCESIEDTKESARLSKILAKGHSEPTYIKRSDGPWTESDGESLDILLNTHFPGCKIDVVETDAPEHIPTLSEDLLKELLEREKIKFAIFSFLPYKSPDYASVFQAETFAIKEALTALNLVKSYISDRSQVECAGNIISSYLPIT
ncbi:uncharacterized protein LOC118752829 [Rhagoletis pomonella]|uniref:uncharacterized protein LOC118752829 n=1 Tax=Rhagoletis pomonella TaxID=28610 RepID=UPI001785F1EC|nr:uncharacterized protein LOC118752829 [Rhagoletis pomonella]